MRILTGFVLATLAAAPLVQAEEAKEQQIHDKPAVRGSIIANMLQDHDNPFTLYPYDTNYVLYTDTSNINKEAIKSYNWADNARKDEVKYQLSLAFPLWRGILGDNSVLGASYTQRSWWQLSNHSESSPFRETNYEPQVFLGWATDYSFAGWTLRDVEVGLNHQSNGRSDPTSRSWNRGYARFMAQNGNWQVDLKPWFRFAESDSSDDNPDITKYMGYYRLKVGYAWGDSVFSVDSHYNWNSGYGGAELGWSYPISKHVRFYTQVFSGYGESLIDYNFRQTRVGVGVMLNDIM
ncbi:Phospholipase A1 precursor [Serratia quinivorans]|jgi:phospholipase A1|uniref:phospholipase A n=1 Tax=Serratia TaxID=613 RepID=UPI00217779AC|nr:phospholipase A [Serratia quinivorans]CAI0917175.1 Phospholipase A1 precursor [Serratia quinivorans]CAI1103621.1 Phospholipase A1 precursor [Serratia quinivorans]CAI1155288.1 Phospholipase A1 precursor [Serratia quinivorans]CAI1890732.1 Phospholipase A1 precursor [Serratia quinivorans]CAI1914702.1 Phospholipase A1 precursor [Serratia quinivorans]